MWWSRGFGGASALDYLIEVRGDPFTKAMEKILGQEAETPSLFYNAGNFVHEIDGVSHS